METSFAENLNSSSERILHVTASTSNLPQNDPNNSAMDEESVLPVYGLPGYKFYTVHVTALVSLTISIVVSIAVLVYLLVYQRQAFWKRPIAERLVVYLSLMDLLYRYFQGKLRVIWLNEKQLL